MWSVITLIIMLAHTGVNKYRFTARGVVRLPSKDLNRGIKHPRLALAESSSCRLHDELQHEKLVRLNAGYVNYFLVGKLVVEDIATTVSPSHWFATRKLYSYPSNPAHTTPHHPQQ